LTAIARQMRQGLILAVSSELNYAGRALVAAVASSEDEPVETISRRLDEAILHCRRARQDATDAAVLFIGDSMREAVRKYGLSNLVDANPQIDDYFSRLKIVNAKIAASRERREDREQAYEEIEEILPSLVAAFEAITLPERRPVFEGGWLSKAFSWATVFGAVSAVLLGLVTRVTWTIDPAFLSAGAAVIGAVVAAVTAWRSRTSGREK
jgi:hypothetical protein